MVSSDNQKPHALSDTLLQGLFRLYLSLLSKLFLRRILSEIKSSGAFDENVYLLRAPEVKRLAIDPIVHFLFYGRFRGVEPGAHFHLYFQTNTMVGPKTGSLQTLFRLIFHRSEEIKPIPCNEIIQKIRTTAITENFQSPDKEIHITISPYEHPERFPWFEKEKFPNIPASKLRLIAFYLPQFHPFDENDRFWGKGFTEWHNVSRALPVFQGHYQPKLPGELGFYDLRLKPVMERQISLAKQYGIHGFCFHHYFLDSRPVMRTPFNLFLQNKDLNIPFCLHWANEPWTARWDGNRNREGVLLDQAHDDFENMAFIRDIVPAFQDGRYIRIKGRPVLLIYRPGLFPDFRKTAEIWKEYCLKKSLGELFLVMTQTLFDKDKVPSDYGCDAAVEFPPHLTRRISVKDEMVLHDPMFKGFLYDYKAVLQESIRKPKPDYTLFRGIMPQWDNTARNQAATIYCGADPFVYQSWLSELGKYTVKNLPADRQFIFINAWNEWAEGAYLEPDRRVGYAWLNATARALNEIVSRQ